MILDKGTYEQAKPNLAHTQSARVLIVDDDQVFAGSLAGSLSEDGFSVALASDAGEARRELDAAQRLNEPFDLLLSDVNLPGEDGLTLLERVRRDHPGVVVVMLTGFGTVESAVRAIRLGASDYLTKPIVASELAMALERALHQRELLSENGRLKRELGAASSLDSIIGQHPSLAQALETARRVADTSATVLMTGESGTGKSMVARAIHAHSDRASGPFVEMHCGAIPESLLESELFGHVAGAFTDARTEKRGKFLAAHNGTIFIDEINSASPAMQLKLLRVLQDRRFEPVGSNDTVEVDVRVLLATNRPLETLVQDGVFREDLYYRINVVRVHLPPLRERAGDIPLLVEHFMRKHSQRHARQTVSISADALRALEHYAFPGNIRELENAIERAVVLAKRPTIELDDLPASVRTGGDDAQFGAVGGAASSADDPDTPWTPMPLADAIAEPERRIILKALRANDWNRQATAEQLQINRTTLYKKMKALGIDQAGR